MSGAASEDGLEMNGKIHFLLEADAVEHRNRTL